MTAYAQASRFVQAAARRVGEVLRRLYVRVGERSGGLERDEEAVVVHHDAARELLHRVRDALQTPSRSAKTVSSIALDWGFWHFGEFSRAYRACFGELPSETLRRHRAEPAG